MVLTRPSQRITNTTFSAAQDHCQPKVTLTRFEQHFAAPQDAPGSERLQHGELPVIQFWKSDALGIAVELLVFFEFSHKPSVLLLRSGGAASRLARLASLDQLTNAQRIFFPMAVTGQRIAATRGFDQDV